MRNCSLKVSSGLALIGMAAFALAQTETEIIVQLETKSAPIEAPVRYQVNRTLRPGTIRRAFPGERGEVRRTFRISYQDDKVVGRELVEEVRTEPKPVLYHISPAGYRTDRGSFSRGRVMKMRASAYTACPSENGGWTRTKLGHPLRYGVVAVDPRVIPLGSMLFIEGYGLALASDTGSAIKGNRIDLLMATKAQAYRFGRRSVTVHVLKRG